MFKEVAETHNITLSARNLHMSQPSISLQIQNLECEYNTIFFDRTNKGVTLTKEGKIFYDRICTILDILESFKEEINTLSKDPRRLIYLGATSTIGEYVLPNILAFLFRTHPEVDFKVKIANTESITQDVLDKKIHIGLTVGPVSQYKNLKVESFWEDELVVVLPYSHPWASRKSITLAELSQERMVTREASSATRKVMEVALKESGLDPEQLNVKMELGSTQAIKQVVAAGLGITIISSLAVSKERDRRLFKILKIRDAPLKLPLSLLTNALITQTKDERVFIDLLHDHALIADILRKDYQGLEEHESRPCYTLPAVSPEAQEHSQVQ